MPKTYKRRSHHTVWSKIYKQRSRRVNRRRKRVPVSPFPIFLGTLLLLLILLAGWWFTRSTPIGGGGGMYDSQYKVGGSPSIDVDLINQVLDYYESPARGKGQALYNLGVKYGVDPVYALAFFMQESRFGTTGVAQVTLSLGNIRATHGYESYHGYRKYKDWEAGFEDWYRLIKVQYMQKWKLKTVNQIIPVYAPSEDNNDVDAYIRAVKSAVNTWRSGEIRV